MAHQARFRDNLLYISCILLASCVGKQHAVEPTQLFVLGDNPTIRFNNGVVYKDNQPFTGILYNYYIDTKDTADVTPYLSGREHGEKRKYYPNKQLWEKRYFHQGNKVGEMRTYWSNGKPQIQYFFANGEYEGTCKEWTSAGMLSRLMHYKKGYEDGEQKWWYDNGKIRANYVIIEGRRYGLLGTKNCINVSDSIFKK